MRTLVITTAFLLAGCGAAADTPGVLASEPWVRTTDGAQEPSMTAVYVSLTNPTSDDVVLVSADCGDIAERTELHEIVTQDGESIMRAADNGITVPAESHEHLAPGGPHIMLMDLARALPVGSEELSCTLTFDDGQTVEILAPVKEFTEEQETYHTHE